MRFSTTCKQGKLQITDDHLIGVFSLFGNQPVWQEPAANVRGFDVKSGAFGVSIVIHANADHIVETVTKKDFDQLLGFFPNRPVTQVAELVEQPYPMQPSGQLPPPPPYSPQPTPIPGQYPSYPGQQPPKKPFYRRAGCLAGIIVLALVLCIASTTAAMNGGKGAVATPTAAVASQSTTHAGPTATPTPQPTPTPNIPHFGDGMFKVGKDIQPGTYRTRQGTANCYYARLSGFGGTVGEIIANDNTDGPAVITIDAGDAGFQSVGCGMWTADLSQITQSKNSFGDGTYIVNTDMDPGTYQNTGGSGCYYARVSAFGGTIDDIIANQNTDNQAIVTIDAGDAGFMSVRCGTWTKM